MTTHRKWIQPHGSQYGKFEFIRVSETPDCDSRAVARVETDVKLHADLVKKTRQVVDQENLWLRTTSKYSSCGYTPARYSVTRLPSVSNT